MQGWVSVYRELLTKPIWTASTPEQKTILMTLILMANHEDNEWEFKGEKFTVKKGQMITSLESIVQNCGKGVTMQNVRTALKRFEKYGFLTNESTNKNRLITLVNWEVYQNSGEGSNKQTNKQLTSNQQATNKQLTTNNNDNNDNNENKIKHNAQKALEDSLKMDFDNFWSVYPKKTDKSKAFQSFKKVLTKKDPIHGKATLSEVMQGTENYRKSCELKGTDKQYIKAATTFLNGYCFKDEFDLTPTGNFNKGKSNVDVSSIFDEFKNMED